MKKLIDAECHLAGMAQRFNARKSLARSYIRKFMLLG